MAYSPAVISGSRFFRKSADSLMIRSWSALSAGRLASAAVGLSKSAAAKPACHRGRGRVVDLAAVTGGCAGKFHGDHLLPPAADLAALEGCRAEAPFADRLDHGLVEGLLP